MRRMLKKKIFAFSFLISLITFSCLFIGGQAANAQSLIEENKIDIQNYQFVAENQKNFSNNVLETSYTIPLHQASFQLEENHSDIILTDGFIKGKKAGAWAGKRAKKVTIATGHWTGKKVKEFTRSTENWTNKRVKKVKEFTISTENWTSKKVRELTISTSLRQ
ncbi:MAG: hypothetical protein QNJ38_04440 [Prochloraceae cyanobacterium]|nr:hypothetical protein [Prochloraceae cyanobacterium]